MANEIDISKAEFINLSDDDRQQIHDEREDDPILRVERVYQLWWHWADFELYIVNPVVDVNNPPLIIKPDLVEGYDEEEFVYNIHDYGHKLTTSKADDMFAAGKSMCKLSYTIEKIIFILVERLKSLGISPEQEVQVAFGGHEIAQRKAFESIINLSYNVVVTNFDPGEWGEKYLENVRTLAKSGKGHPAEAPRSTFKQHHGSGPSIRS